MNARFGRFGALCACLLIMACGEDETASKNNGLVTLCQETRQEDGTIKLVCSDSEATIQPGTDGAVMSSAPPALLSTESIDEGNECTNGGTRIYFGADDDFNGVLEPSEHDGSSTICNGADGQDARALLINSQTIDPGEVCDFGGQRILVGVDDNGNQTLDDNETDAQINLCIPPCPLGYYFDQGANSCLLGQIVILEGTIDKIPSPFVNGMMIDFGVKVGDPFRFALIYDLERQITGDLQRFGPAIRTHASYQQASLAYGDRLLRWLPPRPNWFGVRGREVRLVIYSFGFVSMDGFEVNEAEITLNLKPGTIWGEQAIPPSSALGETTSGSFRIGIANHESNGILGTINRVSTPQVFDITKLAPTQ